ncbi:hypothetical protein [Photobacterium damselae]|uniref:hypothetical protein n=1 Tax=Photobacterium damselae TaxID=38293 RepID=UPI004068CBDE
MKRNHIDEKLLFVAQNIDLLKIHHQPKKDNRRWGVRQDRFKHGTAWISPVIKEEQFTVELTGDFNLFSYRLKSISLRQGQNQGRVVYYFTIEQAEEVLVLLSAQS